MPDTLREIAVLLSQLFQDGQADGSISAQDFRDMIVSLDVRRLATSKFGTMQPFPAMQRLIGLPPAMATPPTVTQGTANAASTIASAVATAATVNSSGTWIKNTAVPWKYSGGKVDVVSQAANALLTVCSFNCNALAGGNMFVESMFDGSVFEFGTRGISGNAAFRILVDGQYVSSTPTIGPPGDGALYWQKVDFSGVRAVRRIRIELTNQCGFRGFNVGPNDTLWPSSLPDGPRSIWMGDSKTNGTGATAQISGFVDRATKLLGWSRDAWTSGIGGAGYLNVTQPTFRSRVVTDVINNSPEIVVIQGGGNDSAFSAAQIQAEATTLYAQIRAALPYVKLIVIGDLIASGTPTSFQVSMRDALKAALLAGDPNGPNLFIDPIVSASAVANTLGFITGTGKVGATTGSGNADLLTGSDGIHPTQSGDDYFGDRIYQAIAAPMPF
ncbi:MAG: SGNH/GDSL hydrolase family protein [Gemmatimonadaceae bacterium]